MNSDKSEFMSSYQDGVIFSLNGKSIKSVEQFIYLGSKISATQNDMSISIGKACTAIDKLIQYGNLISPLK